MAQDPSGEPGGEGGQPARGIRVVHDRSALGVPQREVHVHAVADPGRIRKGDEGNGQSATPSEVAHQLAQQNGAIGGHHAGRGPQGDLELARAVLRQPALRLQTRLGEHGDELGAERFGGAQALEREGRQVRLATEHELMLEGSVDPQAGGAQVVQGAAEEVPRASGPGAAVKVGLVRQVDPCAGNVSVLADVEGGGGIGQQPQVADGAEEMPWGEGAEAVQCEVGGHPSDTRLQGRVEPGGGNRPAAQLRGEVAGRNEDGLAGHRPTSPTSAPFAGAPGTYEAYVSYACGDGCGETYHASCSWQRCSPRRACRQVDLRGPRALVAASPGPATMPRSCDATNF